MRRSDHITHGYSPAVHRLSDREHQVARLIAQNLKDAAIARRLGIAASTVGIYVGHIKQRLKLDSRAEIAAWVTARLDPNDPTGRLRRADPARMSGLHPDVRAS
jgi:DNA-binding CsgD family transcriptional regulator